jgi:hypothetical protein
MPFKSKAQRRWMYANDPEMAKEWERETPKDKELPEKVASALFQFGFSKTAGGPGSGVIGNNTSVLPFLETSPLISIGNKNRFLNDHTPIITNTPIDVSKIKYKGQEKIVPKKLVQILINWDKTKNNPIDVIKDQNGDYHVVDGHHRAIAARLLKEKEILANIYRDYTEVQEKTALDISPIGKGLTKVKTIPTPVMKSLPGANRVLPPRQV